MRLLTTLVLTLLFSHPFLYAQVTILGKFLVGDTTHFHILQTERGDSFYGTVMAWDTESLLFKTQDGLRLSFPNSSLISIEVVENQSGGSMAATAFLLKTIDGKKYYGYPQSINDIRIIFDAGNAGYLRLRPSEVESITKELVITSEQFPYENKYVLRPFRQRNSTGRLIGYQDEKLIHQEFGGNTIQIPLNDVNKYEIKKGYQAFLGYDRSLMFMPTGFGMKKSTKEFRNTALGINTIAFGLTDHLSLGTGLIGIFPYGDIKWSLKLAEKLHWSVGGYAVLPFSYGYHSSVSLGTPDYFLNLCYQRNIELEAIDSETDFETVSLGTSMRIGNRSRLFAEFNILTSPVSEFGGNYDVFYEKGFLNNFTWGYGYFGKRYRMELGLMALGPFETFCFPQPCPDIHVPIPVISFGVRF